VPTLAIAVGLSLLGGLGGFLVAAGVLLFRDSFRSRLIPWLVSYAVGALLGVSLLAILPDLFEREFADREANKLPLDAAELGVIRDGLELVVSGAAGTARGAFAGFPLDDYPIAGKTGTAELEGGDINHAWFVAYGPATSPEYVVSVFVERAGHGGETAAPIARQIFEGIFGLDKVTGFIFGSDASG
jgi:hypothetical protein